MTRSPRRVDSVRSGPESAAGGEGLQNFDDSAASARLLAHGCGSGGLLGMAAARPRDRPARRDECIGGSDAQDCCYCPCTRHSYCPVAAFGCASQALSSLLVSQTASSRLLPTVPCPQQRSDARVPERGLGELGTWTRGDERPARTSANSRNLAGRCRCARVLCATTGGTCGTMLRVSQIEAGPIRLSCFCAAARLCEPRLL